MVVLASAITSKSGKALLSRQFVELTRVRIEGLLAAFPKLMSSEKQHTFVETENVRYVYQPLESLYIVVVTNKASNILEDLETLHLLAKIVPEYCHVLEEKEVLKHAFDIIFAFDEAIAMGYKERVNLMQIKQFLTMESNDEQRFKLEEKNKMMIVKKESDRQRKLIDKKKTEERKMGLSHEHGSSMSFSGGSSSKVYAGEPVVEARRESPKVAPSRSVKGLQLGKSKKTSGYAKVLQEENVVDTSNTPIGSVVEQEQSMSHEKVHIQSLEKISLVTENDGGLQSMEVKGELIITTYDSQFAQAQVHISQGENKDFQFKAHPNMSKNMYGENKILALKDGNKSYPKGTPSSILKWRWATKEEKNIPLTINVWPSSSGGETTVPVEYEKNCSFDLANVTISIPIPGGASPVVGELVGNYTYDPKKNILNWHIPLIDDSNSSGSLEFSVPQAPNSGFFPVNVSFVASVTYCAIQAVAVTSGGDHAVAAEFSSETKLSVEQYTIE